MRKLLALLGFAALLVPLPAAAQFLTTETLIASAEYTTDQVSAQRTERPSNVHTIWYFKLDLTEIDGAGANGVTLSVEYYDSVDDEWDGWMTGCTELTAQGECVLMFMRSSPTDWLELETTANNDIDVIHLVPMPAIWRVTVKETTGTPTATYSVEHWRY
jgi:hypothetical protein